MGGSSNYHDLGGAVFSYQTCIWERDGLGRRLFNATKYSMTTSKHQAMCRRSKGIDIELNGVPMDTSSLESWLHTQQTDALDEP